jgi:hypothetical protein
VTLPYTRALLAADACRCDGSAITGDARTETPMAAMMIFMFIVIVYLEDIFYAPGPGM